MHWTHYVKVTYRNGEEKIYKFTTYARAISFRKCMTEFRDELDICKISSVKQFSDEYREPLERASNYLARLLKEWYS